MSTMTYVFSHVNFYGQTETCYGEQAMRRAKLLLRRCSMMLPVVRKLMGITVLVMDIVFMMVVFFLFALMLRFIWVNPLGLHYKEK